MPDSNQKLLMTLSHQKIFIFVVYLIIGLLELGAKPLMGDCPILIKIKPLRHISTTEKNGVAFGDGGALGVLHGQKLQAENTAPCFKQRICDD